MQLQQGIFDTDFWIREKNETFIKLLVYQVHSTVPPYYLYLHCHTPFGKWPVALSTYLAPVHIHVHVWIKEYPKFPL